MRHPKQRSDMRAAVTRAVAGIWTDGQTQCKRREDQPGSPVNVVLEPKPTLSERRADELTWRLHHTNSTERAKTPHNRGVSTNTQQLSNLRAFLQH